MRTFKSICAAILALTVMVIAGGTRAYAADGQVDGDPAGVIAYVQEHMDDKYRDESFDMYMHDSVEHLEVRNTLVDQAQVAPGTSIDEFYEHPDWRDAMYMTYPGITPLYYASHDWLVALVDASRVNGLKADVSDVDVVANNPYADIVEGAVYDNETGLLYIPRDVLENDDLSSKWNESFKDGIVAQTMLRIDPTNVSCSLPVEIRRTGMFGVKTTEFMNVPFAGFDQTFFINLGTSSKVTTSDIWTFTSGSTTSMQMGSGNMQLKDGVFALSITPFAYTGLVVEVDTSSEGIGGLLSPTRAYAAGGKYEPMSTDIADFNMYPFGYLELNSSLWKIGHPGNDYERAMQGTAYTYMGAVLDALAMIPDSDASDYEHTWGEYARYYFDNTGARDALDPCVLGIVNARPVGTTAWNNYLHLQLNDMGANGGEPHNSAIPDNYPQIPDSEKSTYESSWMRFRDFVRAGRVGTMPQLEEAGDTAAFTHAFLLPADDRIGGGNVHVMGKDWWHNLKSANLDTKDRWVFAACSHVTMPIPKDFSGTSVLAPDNGGYLGEGENAYNCFIKFLDVNTDAEVPYVVFGIQSLPFGHLGEGSGHVQESQVILKVRLGGSTRVHKVAKRDVRGTDITEGNSAYNLAGAEYKYYTNRECTDVAKLADGTDAVATTDEYGNTNTLVLPIGKYYVKETKASVGFKLDPDVHEVDVLGYRGDGTPEVAEVESKEPPLTDPISLQKVDRDAFAIENSNDAQGDGDLNGTVFQISYYNSYLNESQLDSVMPTRSWKIKTYPTHHSDGRIISETSMQYAWEDPEHYLVENDPKGFYLVDDGSGQIKTDFPLGTVAVREITPPKGYLLHDAGTSEPKTYYAHIITNASNNPVVEWKNWSDANGTFSVVKNPPIRGGIKVGKFDVELGEDIPQGAATLAGAEFTIYNKSANSVIVNDTVYQRDAAVMTITTNADGVAQTARNALPYGTYEVRETKAPTGYVRNADWKRTITVDENNTYEEYTYDRKADPNLERPCPEHPVRGGISLIKEDVESGGTPQGDASFANIKFDVINKNENPVMVNGKRYEKGARISGLLVTDENGHASTAADALPYGKYTVEEAETNESMRKTAGPQDVTISENGKIVAMKSKYKDEVVRGGLDVKKVDSTYWGDSSSGLPDKKMETGQGDATLAGAKFRVYNVSKNAIYLNGVRKESVGKIALTDEQMSSGKITWLSDIATSVRIDDDTPYVAELTTDENGECRMDVTSLPYGTYVLREVAPPRGYTTGEQWYTGAVFAVRKDKQIVKFSQLTSKGHYNGRDEWDESVTYEFDMKD